MATAGFLRCLKFESKPERILVLHMMMADKYLNHSGILLIPLPLLCNDVDRCVTRGCGAWPNGRWADPSIRASLFRVSIFNRPSVIIGSSSARSGIFFDMFRVDKVGTEDDLKLKI